MALQLPVESEDIHEKFRFVGRYSYVGARNTSSRFPITYFPTGNRYTERVLNHTNDIEIWKSEDSVIVFSWTENEYEQKLVYMLDAETDEDEDWSVLAVMENENSLKIKWKSRTGRATSQTARYEFTDEKLIISIVDEPLTALVVHFKKIDEPRSDLALMECCYDDL